MDKVYNQGDIAWVLTSTILVFLMIPGLGYFYSGLAQTENALSLMMLSCLSVAIVSIEWFVVGYSLAFSKTGGPFIGNFNNAFLMGVLDQPSVGSSAVPDILFMIYQGMFAALTPALAVGAAAERGRILPTAIFILLWSLFAYNFVVFWTWSPNGWGTRLGVLDFAGGTPVHTTSGFSALVFSSMLSHREGRNKEELKPHNVNNVILGTSLLWFGWFGFNGGSALASNIHAVVACVNTNVAASAGGLTWMLIEYIFVERKYSALAFCSGVVAGLVVITPAAGFVDMPASLLFGVLGSIFCNAAVRLKRLMYYDDTFDVFAIHGVGGMLGSLLTGIFARKSIAALDPNIIIDGGWLDGNWIQILYQLVDCSAGAVWSSLVTFIILFAMKHIPGLDICASSKSARTGLDLSEIGQQAYDIEPVNYGFQTSPHLTTISNENFNKLIVNEEFQSC